MNASQIVPSRYIKCCAYILQDIKFYYILQTYDFIEMVLVLCEHNNRCNMQTSFLNNRKKLHNVLSDLGLSKVHLLTFTEFHLGQNYKRLVVIKNCNKNEKPNNWYATNSISILAITRKRNAM